MNINVDFNSKKITLYLNNKKQENNEIIHNIEIDNKSDIGQETLYTFVTTFEDVPFKHKTYQLCLKEYLKHNCKGDQMKNYSGVLKLFQHVYFYARYDGYTIKDYLNNTVPNKSTIDKYIRYFVGQNITTSLALLFGKKYYNIFCREMIQSKAVLSGSFILDNFYGEKKSSDIDIFVNKSKSYTFLNCMREKFKIINEHDNCKNEYLSLSEKDNCKKAYLSLSEKDNCKKDNYKYNLNKIDSIYTFMCNGYKIQFILIQDNINLINYINKSFDINIVKNMYYYDDTLVPITILNNIKSLILKEAKFDTYKHNIDTRRNKYIKKGFVFEN
jgi:hypothetical protein